MVTAHHLELEEFERYPVGHGDSAGSIAVQQLIAAWSAAAQRDAAGYFDYGAGYIQPQNWVGTVYANGVSMQVVPRGAKGLPPDGRDQLERNIAEMLHLTMSSRTIAAGQGEISLRGSRREKVIEAYCDLVATARRERIIRQYRVNEAARPTIRGHLVFPQQARYEIAAPGLFASRWVALTEDSAINRFLKTVLVRCRPWCNGLTRRRVDEVLATFDEVSTSPDPLAALSQAQHRRLPASYQRALDLGRSLLLGDGAGIFAGRLTSPTEVIFMAPLFEAFVAKLTRAAAAANRCTAQVAQRGRYLGSWVSGPATGTSAVELIPDAELISPDTGSTTIIIDAKWKWLSPQARQLGISAADVQQVYTYAAALGCRRAILAYPCLELPDPPNTAISAIRVVGPGPEVSIYVGLIPLLAPSPTAMATAFAELIAAILVENGVCDCT